MDSTKNLLDEESAFVRVTANPTLTSSEDVFNFKCKNTYMKVHILAHVEPTYYVSSKCYSPQPRIGEIERACTLVNVY